MCICFGEMKIFNWKPVFMQCVNFQKSSRMRNQAHLSYLLPLFARLSVKFMWERGILHCWHTEDFSVRWQETELPGWSACLINNTRGSGHTMHLKESKCGPQSLSLCYTLHTLFPAYCTHEHNHKHYVSFSHPFSLSND